MFFFWKLVIGLVAGLGLPILADILLRWVVHGSIGDKLMSGETSLDIQCGRSLKYPKTILAV
jgi:hypothetical protein